MLFVSHKIWNIDKNISNLWYTFPTFELIHQTESCNNTLA
jgi:hypothetical protein